MRLCELKQKEVINTCTCKSLGPGRFCCFWGRESEYIIPWNCICQIGDDIILVEIQEDKCFRK